LPRDLRSSGHLRSRRVLLPLRRRRPHLVAARARRRRARRRGRPLPPGIRVDRSTGDVFVAYKDSRTIPAERRRRYLRRSNDGGESWEPAVRLSSATTARRRSSSSAIPERRRRGRVRSMRPGRITARAPTRARSTFGDGGAARTRGSRACGTGPGERPRASGKGAP
jgi:hypothetical protein